MQKLTNVRRIYYVFVLIFLIFIISFSMWGAFYKYEKFFIAKINFYLKSPPTITLSLNNIYKISDQDEIHIRINNINYLSRLKNKKLNSSLGHFTFELTNHDIPIFEDVTIDATVIYGSETLLEDIFEIKY